MNKLLLVGVLGISGYFVYDQFINPKFKIVSVDHANKIIVYNLKGQKNLVWSFSNPTGLAVNNTSVEFVKISNSQVHVYVHSIMGKSLVNNIIFNPIKA